MCRLCLIWEYLHLMFTLLDTGAHRNLWTIFQVCHTPGLSSSLVIIALYTYRPPLSFYVLMNNHLILGDCEKRAKRAAQGKPRRLLIPIGGAGAQKKIIMQFLGSLKDLLHEGKVGQFMNHYHHFSCNPNP